MAFLGRESRPELVTQCSLETEEVVEVFTIESTNSYLSQKGEQRKRELSTAGKTVLLIACAGSNFICIGFSVGLGVIFVEILKVFETTRALTSLIQTMCMGIIYIGALFIGPIVQRLKPGPSIFVGGLMSEIGLLGASFASSVPVLIITVGFVTAVGLCFGFIASYMAVSKAMGRQQSLGISVITAGTGLGSFLFPQLMATVLEVFGWRGTFLVVSGITLNLCVLGCLVHVLTKSMFQSQEPTKTTGGVKSFRRSLNLHIFKNSSFVILLVLQLPLWTFVTGQTVFIVDMAESRGFELRQASFLLSAKAIGYIPGSFLSSLFISLCHIPSLLVLSVSLILIAITSLGWVYFTSYGVLVALALAHGLTVSLADASTPVVVLDIMGQELYPSALSFFFGLSGLSDMSSGPASGAIRDATGDYIYMFYLSSASCGSVAVIYTCLSVYLMWKKRNKIGHINKETANTRL